MNKEIATQKDKPKTLSDWLISDTFKAQLAMILPKHVTSDRFVRSTLTALQLVPDLKKCTQESFFNCALRLAATGLECDGRRAHLIPFRNNKKGGVFECTLILDYKGLIELAYNSGTVAAIHADVVCDNDDFDYDMGQVTRHKIDLRKPRGEVYAAYSIITMKDGARVCVVMSRDEIENIRKRSKTPDRGPWVTDWNEQAKKTTLRRATKYIKLSPEVAQAIDRDDDVIETRAVPVIPANSLDDLAAQFQIQEPETEIEYEHEPGATEATEPEGSLV